MMDIKRQRLYVSLTLALITPLKLRNNDNKATGRRIQ